MKMPNPIRNQIERNIAKGEAIKDIRYLYKPKQYYDNDDDIECKGLRDIRTLFEPEENYYEPMRIDNSFSNNYIEYESNGDKTIKD